MKFNKELQYTIFVNKFSLKLFTKLDMCVSINIINNNNAWKSSARGITIISLVGKNSFVNFEIHSEPDL